MSPNSTQPCRVYMLDKILKIHNEKAKGNQTAKFIQHRPPKFKNKTRSISLSQSHMSDDR